MKNKFQSLIPQSQKLEKIERLLKSWTCRIPSLRNMNYWQRLKELKMNSEQRRLERYRVIYTWKVVQGLVPNPGIVEAKANEYLGRRCCLPKLNHRTRMSIPTLKNHSFQTNGPVLFNSLPKAIRNMKKCTEEFKEELDIYLQKVPDQPKIDGLIPWGQDLEGKPSNSIQFQLATGSSGRRPGA